MGIHFKIANAPADKGANAVAYYLKDGATLNQEMPLDFTEHASKWTDTVAVGDVIVIYQIVHGAQRVVTHVVVRTAATEQYLSGYFPWSIPVRVLARLKPNWFADSPPHYNAPGGLLRAAREPDPGAFAVNDALWIAKTQTMCPVRPLAQSGRPYQTYGGYSVQGQGLIRLVQDSPTGASSQAAYEWTADFVATVTQNCVPGINS